jgi:hypothetical protein
MIWLYTLADRTSNEVARYIREWFANNSSPSTVYYDNSTEFQGDFNNLVKNHSPPIRVIKGRAYHPKSQGIVEVHNREFKRHLTALQIERGVLG